jgi:hypothetical protein
VFGAGSGPANPRGSLEQGHGWAEGHHYGTVVQQHLTIEKNDEASWRSSCVAWRMCRPIGDRPGGLGHAGTRRIPVVAGDADRLAVDLSEALGELIIRSRES